MLQVIFVNVAWVTVHDNRAYSLIQFVSNVH